MHAPPISTTNMLLVAVPALLVIIALLVFSIMLHRITRLRAENDALERQIAERMIEIEAEIVLAQISGETAHADQLEAQLRDIRAELEQDASRRSRSRPSQD